MIKFENTEVLGWEHAIRGMRNSMKRGENLIDEWRDVVGFEGLYQVNDQGEIKSVERRKKNNGGTQFVNERIRVLTPDRYGYLKVCLSKNGQHYTMHGTGRIRTAMKQGRAVIQLDMHDNVIDEFYSMGVASKTTGIPQPNIFKVCNDERNTAGGYKWRYKDDHD